MSLWIASWSVPHRRPRNDWGCRYHRSSNCASTSRKLFVACAGMLAVGPASAAAKSSHPTKLKKAATRSLEELEQSLRCPVELHRQSIERSLRSWNVSARLGHPITHAYLDQVFETHACLIRVLIHKRRVYVRERSQDCINGGKNAVLQIGRLFSLLVDSGVDVPDVELLLNTRDRPQILLHEPAPVFSTWTTDAHADIPFPDPRRVGEAADGCKNANDAEAPRFEARTARLLFRGALSGATAESPMHAESFAAHPRARLMLLAEQSPHLIDAGITPGNPESGIPPELVNDTRFRQFYGHHRKTPIPQPGWSRHRFQAVIDGVSGASRLACSLLSGSVVLKQTSPFYSWFEPWLEPFVHYIPVAYDLSDLTRRVKLAISRPAQMQRIAKDSASHVGQFFRLESIICYVARLLLTYRAVLGFAPAKPSAGEGWQQLVSSSELPEAGGLSTTSTSTTTNKLKTEPSGTPACTQLLVSGKTKKALRCYTKQHNKIRSPHQNSTGDFDTTWLKLKHDTEMLEHLGKDRLMSKLRDAPVLYRDILNAADKYRQRPTKSFKIELPEGRDREMWRATHNRDVYTPPAANQRLSSVLNPKLDFDALQDKFFSTASQVSADARCTGSDSGGWVIVDNLLTPEALSAVRSYLTESTFYYYAKFGGHYLSSRLEDGMAAPLISQISEELREQFHRILGNHPLRAGWAFKFDNVINSSFAHETRNTIVTSTPGRQVGVGVHADSAAVNLNFWPIEGSSEDQGGLTVYKVGAPPAMQFSEFNDPKHLKTILDGAPQVDIPYKANRLVIFNSNLLHETGRLHFRPGYLRRRINLTLLFGKRCGR